jgi:MoaA/NifB/PqqE/SkfB family radical SAM enzyme
VYRYDDIQRVHLEVTTRCNAACPQCGRNIGGGRTNPRLPIVALTLGQTKTIFPAPFLRSLKDLVICGNYGDAITSPHILAICAFLRSANPDLRIVLHTNGSARTAEFWRDLASLITRCVFSIDGLADTNHFYRRHTSWRRIVNNAKAFIDAGGTASWNFIAFRHNEHQISEATELARNLGFKHFFVKKTDRFLRSGQLQLAIPIFNSSGAIVGHLEAPSSPELRNSIAEEISARGLSLVQYERDLGVSHIECAAAASRGIYVSAEGFVFPCCWMGQLYNPEESWNNFGQILKLLEKCSAGMEALNATLHPLQAIIESEFFQTIIPGAWDEGADRLKVCAIHCGHDRVSGAQKGHSLL